MENLANEVEEAAKRREISQVYKITRELSGKRKNGEKPVKSKDGKLLTTERKLMLRWNEHFKEVLNREDININNNQNSIPPIGDPLNINIEPITEDEIIKAIKRLINGKSPGIDSITAEVLKVDIETTTKVMHKLFQQTWNHAAIPHNWAKGIIIKLPKKGDLSDCNNWRGVTLLSVPSKIFLRVLLNRIWNTSQNNNID